MAGLMTALALRESGVFTTIDVFEQTRTPSTAGAGLNIPPNAARLARSLGVDLDGGDPKGPHGAIDGGRAATLSETRMVWEDGSITRKPLDHNTSANDHAGFHHMHRLDLLMCLYKRVLEFSPETGDNCPIQIHMAKRLEAVRQDGGAVTVTFSDGATETGDLLIGADGVDSQVLEAVWPGVSTKRWTEVVVYRGLVPRDRVAAARKPDGSPLDYNPIETMSMDTRETPTAQHLTYWVRGGELLNVWLTYSEPNAEEFERQEGDWFPADRDEMVGNMSKAFEGDPRHDDVVALTSLMENPTKWGLYDRDALENWTEGRVGLVGDAAHPMLPTFGQGAAQAFEDAAALGKCFELHGTDIYRALLHYERVRYYRATRFQFASKFLFKHLEPEDSPERRKILAAVNERDYPVFDHTERAGSDDSWIYAFDARAIGDKLPIRKLGPWHFRSRNEALKSARREVATSLWKPAKPWTGDRPVTREELAQHATFDDCWVVDPRQGLRLHRVEGPPPGRALRRAHVRRQGRHGGVRRVPQPARRAAHAVLLRRAARRSPRRARRRRVGGRAVQDLTGRRPMQREGQPRSEARCGSPGELEQGLAGESDVPAHHRLGGLRVACLDRMEELVVELIRARVERQEDAADGREESRAHVVDGGDQHRIAGRLGDAVVKIGVDRDEARWRPGGIRVGDEIVHRRDQSSQPGEVLGCASLRGQPCRRRLDRETEVDDDLHLGQSLAQVAGDLLAARARRDDDRASVAPAPDLHEPLALQHADRLADRRARHAELLRQLALGRKPRTRVESPELDRPPHLFEHELMTRGPPDHIQRADRTAFFHRAKIRA